MAEQGYLLTEAEVAAIMAQKKVLPGDIEWKQSPEKSSFLEFSANLQDEQGNTIPGLTVRFQYRKGIVADHCKYKFTVFKFKNRVHRVYQLEVVPPDQPAHTENGKKWYGPHQHVGLKTERLAESKTLGCNDHKEWFNVFLKLANISFGGTYEQPEPQPGLPLEQT